MTTMQRCAVTVVAVGVFGGVSHVQAATTCEIVPEGDGYVLHADCETDETLFIPDGAVLEGGQHRITALDSESEPFSGAVLQNAGSEAHVRDVVVDARSLQGCAGVSGIRFEDASGSIQGSSVLHAERGGCQSRHGIEVRSSAGGATEVQLVGNLVTGAQKTGLLAVGDVEVLASFNRITGLGSTELLAQNGIQLSGGARGSVKYNRVRGHIYAPATFAASGILLLNAGADSEVALNSVADADVGVRLVGTSDSEVSGNRISGATFDGIALDGVSGNTTGNRVVANVVRDSGIGVDLFGEGTTDNAVRKNRVTASSLAGIQVAVAASRNRVKLNAIKLTDGSGILVDSDRNLVVANAILKTGETPLDVTGSDNLVTANLVR